MAVSKQTSPLLTAANLDTLLSPTAEARTIGGVTWKLDGTIRWEGEVDVRTVLPMLASCRLRLVVNKLAPSEPKLQYLVKAGRNGFAARRLCLNVPHSPFDGTHKHRAEPGSGDEDTYEPDDIPELPLAPRVAPGTYRAILEAFAKECFIEIGPDFVWTEP